MGMSMLTRQPPPAAPPGRNRWLWLLGVIAGALVAALLAVAISSVLPRHHAKASEEPPVPASWHRTVVTGAGLADRTGVRVTRVDLTSEDGLIDLRFQVLDPNKADSVHQPSTPPALVDERTGLVVHQLFMDHAHQGAFKQGVTYYFLFNNPGNWVHRGTTVTVLLGDAQLEHVVVK